MQAATILTKMLGLNDIEEEGVIPFTVLFKLVWILQEFPEEPDWLFLLSGRVISGALRTNCTVEVGTPRAMAVRMLVESKEPVVSGPRKQLNPDARMIIKWLTARMPLSALVGLQMPRLGCPGYPLLLFGSWELQSLGRIRKDKQYRHVSIPQLVIHRYREQGAGIITARILAKLSLAFDWGMSNKFPIRG